MTDYEDVLRQEARRRAWTVEVNASRISVDNVPYRKQDGGAAKCQVSVETLDDGVSMKAPENSGGAIHAARISGVEGGRAYQATGEPVGNVLWTDKSSACVISIKRDEGEYLNAWHALIVYTSSIAGEVGAEDRNKIETVFEFEIDGDDARDMKNWRDHARTQRIGIVGLGGVGLWILDLMSKSEVIEIRVWDGDEIEGRNLARAPGWASRDSIGQNKAEYYAELYRGMRRGIYAQGRYWRPEEEDSFEGLDFVFVAVDKTETRSALCEDLEKKGIPFVDVGMGIELRDGRVRGSCQAFYSGEDPGRWRIAIPTVEGLGEQQYRQLQLADLGALNAALAVGLWRRHVGQYEREEKDWLVRCGIADNEFIKRAEQT
ncbi:MAG: ThiF family adenylyltransferase [Chloroflexi bacterium]|nr:ThiF family adenylyltransferase [Chloroflexota bacterium]